MCDSGLVVLTNVDEVLPSSFHLESLSWELSPADRDVNPKRLACSAFHDLECLCCKLSVRSRDGSESHPSQSVN